MADNKVIRFYAVDSYPWGYRADGEDKGIIVDWGKAIMSYAELPIEITLAPLSRILADMSTGRADATIHFADDRFMKVSVLAGSTPAQRSGFITLRGNPIGSMEDLYGKVVCQNLGSIYGEAYDSEKRISRLYIGSYTQIIKLVYRKRCDAGVGLIRGLFTKIQALNLPKDTFDNPLYIDQELSGGLLLSKSTIDQKTAGHLKRVMRSLHARNEFERIQERYFTSD
ncbi:transporter substrate-binding domain-containing protein [Pseudomaricurvus alkylphenolicus]|uniref:substrate-binding periplasmic protein n=1 Tax=Pseudomaricurvus alkylphenolicus TaxID=1306991 RepID=UPI00141E29B7|nr:transporter substrate-binding domain-containing protein [Pseudomaricurvus alkylphenolicus]NIB38482.1 transporter substrate-binding domain-containing protein [Pseudomaricurvus alkylphenolicus]